MKRAASILAVLLAVAACAALPKATPPHEPPKPVEIHDDQTRKLAHDAEMDRISEKYEEARNQLRIEREQQRGRMVTLLTWGGALAILAGGVLLWFRIGLWIVVAMAGVLSLALAFSIDRYADLLATIGLAGVGSLMAIGLGILVWMALDLARARATVSSMVKVGEEAKRQMPEAAEAIFGSGGIASRIMHRPEKKVVALERRRIEATESKKEKPS